MPLSRPEPEGGSSRTEHRHVYVRPDWRGPFPCATWDPRLLDPLVRGTRHGRVVVAAGLLAAPDQIDATFVTLAPSESVHLVTALRGRHVAELWLCGAGDPSAVAPLVDDLLHRALMGERHDLGVVKVHLSTGPGATGLVDTLQFAGYRVEVDGTPLTYGCEAR